MPTKHTVRLSDQQRRHLDGLTRTGHAHARTLRYARALLLVDEADGGMAWLDEKVTAALGVSARTGAWLRKHSSPTRLDEAVGSGRQTPGRPPKIDGAAEAHLDRAGVLRAT